MVPSGRLELPRLAALRSKRSMSANSNHEGTKMFPGTTMLAIERHGLMCQGCRNNDGVAPATTSRS